jgi:membrane protease subunit HflK
VLIWLASGIYIVQPSQKGVVLRFGKHVTTVEPGPHYHWPYPIETVYRPNVTEVRTVEVGFRSTAVPVRRSAMLETGAMPEAVMLTGDENIVYLDFAVKYRLNDPVLFLFRSADPDRAVRGAAEAVMREVIGNTYIDPILTTGKEEIQITARRMLQEILDRYQVGIAVDAVELQDVHPPQEVFAAFKDVIDASEDQRRFVNTATAFRNDILPRAVGSAEEMINQARAYREARIMEAQGEAARFLALRKEYVLAEGVTRQRMYLEAMEAILTSPGMEKLILPDESASRLLPFLPLTGGTQ